MMDWYLQMMDWYLQMMDYLDILAPFKGEPSGDSLSDSCKLLFFSQFWEVFLEERYYISMGG
jgi:hypothetical protein